MFAITSLVFVSWLIGHYNIIAKIGYSTKNTLKIKYKKYIHIHRSCKTQGLNVFLLCLSAHWHIIVIFSYYSYSSHFAFHWLWTTLNWPLDVTIVLGNSCLTGPAACYCLMTRGANAIWGSNRPISCWAEKEVDPCSSFLTASMPTSHSEPRHACWRNRSTTACQRICEDGNMTEMPINLHSWV